MPAVTGKTGADAIFKALHRCCIVLGKYEVKLIAVINLMHTSALLTDAQQTAALTFIAASTAACDVFKVIADYSGF